MASYEEAAAAVTITEISDSFKGMDDATMDAINGILAENQFKDENGKDAVVVQNYGTPNDTDKPVTVISVNEGANDGKPITSADDLDAPVVLVGKDGPAIATKFGKDALVKAIVLGEADNNSVVFASDNTNDLNVTMGAGNGNQVVTAAGDDTISYTGGNNATVNTGSGTDTVVVTGTGTGTTISQGEGDFDLTVLFNSPAIFDSSLDPIVATIDGGDGFDTLQMGKGTGDRLFHTFTKDANGNVVMHSNGSITLGGMEIITYDTNGDNILTPEDQMTIIANDVNDTLVARLYQIAYGRQPFDSYDANATGNAQAAQALAGINYWITDGDGKDHFYQANGKTWDGYAKDDLQHLVYAFLNQDEFYSTYKVTKGENVGDLVGLNAENYVTQLWDNLGAADNAKINGATKADFVAALENGDLNAFDVAYQMASSDVADQILGADGNHYVIEPWNLDQA